MRKAHFRSVLEDSPGDTAKCHCMNSAECFHRWQRSKSIVFSASVTMVSSPVTHNRLVFAVSSRRRSLLVSLRSSRSRSEIAGVPDSIGAHQSSIGYASTPLQKHSFVRTDDHAKCFSRRQTTGEPERISNRPQSRLFKTIVSLPHSSRAVDSRVEILDIYFLCNK